MGVQGLMPHMMEKSAWVFVRDRTNDGPCPFVRRPAYPRGPAENAGRREDRQANCLKSEMTRGAPSQPRVPPAESLFSVNSSPRFSSFRGLAGVCLRAGVGVRWLLCEREHCVFARVSAKGALFRDEHHPTKASFWCAKTVVVPCDSFAPFLHFFCGERREAWRRHHAPVFFVILREANPCAKSERAIE